MGDLIKIISSDFKKQGLKTELNPVTAIFLTRIEQYIDENRKAIIKEIKKSAEMKKIVEEEYEEEGKF